MVHWVRIGSSCIRFRINSYTSTDHRYLNTSHGSKWSIFHHDLTISLSLINNIYNPARPILKINRTVDLCWSTRLALLINDDQIVDRRWAISGDPDDDDDDGPNRTGSSLDDSNEQTKKESPTGSLFWFSIRVMVITRCLKCARTVSCN